MVSKHIENERELIYKFIITKNPTFASREKINSIKEDLAWNRKDC